MKKINKNTDNCLSNLIVLLGKLNQVTVTERENLTSNKFNFNNLDSVFSEIQRTFSRLDDLNEDFVLRKKELAIIKELVVGQWWFCDDVPKIDYNGKIYALDCWDGEKFTDCWTCVGEGNMDVGEVDLMFEPMFGEDSLVYDYKISKKIIGGNVK